jgi:hypothetical protein
MDSRVDDVDDATDLVFWWFKIDQPEKLTMAVIEEQEN